VVFFVGQMVLKITCK